MVNDRAVTISSGSGVQAVRLHRGHEAAVAGQPGGHLLRPAMWAIRVCPSWARWATAIRMPRSLSTDTDGRL